MKFLWKKMDFLSLLLLLFSAAAVSRAQVQQEPAAETREGTGVNITCSHPNIQSNEIIYWYRQLPGRGPALIVSAVKGFKQVSDPEGQLWVSADRLSSVLRLARPRLGDAALYYCVLLARGDEPGLRPGTNRLGRGGGTVPSGPAGGAACMAAKLHPDREFLRDHRLQQGGHLLPQERLPKPDKSKPPEVMGTPSELRMRPTAAEVEEPTAVFCGKELRMGPGRVTTTGEGWMMMVEFWHCLTQGSLQLLVRRVWMYGQNGRQLG
ncbi:uncharacterized protein LOC122171829 [Centrocercus urophasianus]|uniref:uncharacterized protein LOC122171829 n=1 Tax=Centrocercus urophasianus TaxID=9002 RepID=UPI001C649B41|nr:uncharacterized protein LOC122171829 [Centrocercus urophasianus]